MNSFIAFFKTIFDALMEIINALSQMSTVEKQLSPPQEENIYGAVEVGMTTEYTQDSDIVIDETIRSKYQEGWEDKLREKPPEEIVIHGTAGGNSVAGLLHWMYNWGRPGYLKGISLFHYAIGRGEKEEKDGLIVEVISPDYWVYHSSSGGHAKLEIGIELLNSSKSNRDPYTDAQYRSLFYLIFEHLFVLYPTITRITGHRYNIWKYNKEKIAQKRDKNCPGNFDWARLEEELEKREYTYETEDTQLHYNITKKLYA